MVLLLGCGGQPESLRLDGRSLGRQGLTEPVTEGLFPEPSTTLQPLPTVDQVQDSVLDRRPDPFQPLEPLVQQKEALLDGIRLKGVLAVGDQKQALLQTPERSGTVCIGPGGLCPGDIDQLLPNGWSVVSIDLKGGCLVLANAGQAQQPFCI